MSFESYVLSADATLREAISKIEANRCRNVLVEQNKKIIGFLSSGDILAAVCRGVGVHSLVTSCLNRQFHSLRERDLSQAWTLFQSLGISMIPVIDDQGGLSEVITREDIYPHLVVHLT